MVQCSELLRYATSILYVPAALHSEAVIFLAGFPSLPLVGKVTNDEAGLKTYPVRVEEGKVEVEV